MRMMLPDYSNPDSTAMVVAYELKLSDELNAKFAPMYATYLNEYKKIDELLPVRMNFEPGQRPSEEQIQQMREVMEARQTVISELQKLYEQKFTELLGAEKYAQLQGIEKEQMEQRIKEMRKRFNRQGGRRGGFGGFGGFGGGMNGGGFNGGDMNGGGFGGDGMN